MSLDPEASNGRPPAPDSWPRSSSSRGRAGDGYSRLGKKRALPRAALRVGTRRAALRGAYGEPGGHLVLRAILRSREAVRSGAIIRRPPTTATHSQPTAG